MCGRLYILGTSHPLQCGSVECLPAHIAAFKAKLYSICESHNIQCIAEEMTKEGLSKHTVDVTVAKEFAKFRGLQHNYVDLTSEERGQFSLRESAFGAALTHIPFKDGGDVFRSAFDKTLSEIRERCWSARILAKQQWPTLVICGANHSRNMRRLWSRFGLRAIVIHNDYEPGKSN